MKCPEHGDLVICGVCRSYFCYDCLPQHSHGTDVSCLVCFDRGCRRCVEKKMAELKAAGLW